MQNETHAETLARLRECLYQPIRAPITGQKLNYHEDFGELYALAESLAAELSRVTADNERLREALVQALWHLAPTEEIASEAYSATRYLTTKEAAVDLIRNNLMASGTLRATETASDGGGHNG